jgi:hypothetical protein|tara:strand:+ start:109 stop:273 length:165 start_codon:yes stop_codon:yes gene_type:complete
MINLDNKRLWWCYSITAAIGLLIVTINMSPASEMVQTVVDTVHSAAKARDGEQY